MSRSNAPARALLPELQRILKLIEAVFPPGAPISTQAFLKQLTLLLDADQANLLLIRWDSRHRAVMVLDNMVHNISAQMEERFTDALKNHRAWTNDPIAQRIHRRLQRRPQTPFGYSCRRWAGRLNGQASYALDFLDNVGVKYEQTSTIPLDGTIYCQLTVYRAKPDAVPFEPYERKLLSILHRTLGDRVIELRARRLREELPAALRSTFTLMLAGHSEKEIAKATHRSPNTVHDHVKRIYQHFHVSSRAQLLARFVNVEQMKSYEV